MIESMLHNSVLNTELLSFLDIKKDGVYVDATYGRGGHSSLVLSRISKSGKLVAFDRDQEAVTDALIKFGSDSRFSINHAKFSCISQLLSEFRNKIDGIYFDLGLSSPQIDNAERGFSFQKSGFIDMRMDQSSGEDSAFNWVNGAKEYEIRDVLSKFGEQRYARSIARKIVSFRTRKTIETTHELAQIVRSCIRYRAKIDPATLTFQAIRIFINDELNELNQALESAAELITLGGKILVISFHSLEDRIVKQRFRYLAENGLSRSGVDTNYRIITKKPIVPSDLEKLQNVRSRSAKLRVIERTQ